MKGIKLIIAAVLALALGASIAVVSAQQLDQQSVTVTEFETINASADFTGSTTVDVFVNDSQGNVVVSDSLSGASGETQYTVLDPVPGEYDVELVADDDTNIGGQSISKESKSVEQRDVLISEVSNESIAADLTVSGSSNLTAQTIIEYNGEILTSETHEYLGSGNTDVLSTVYKPPENGTYNVSIEIVSGSGSMVDGTYFDAVNDDSTAVVGTDDGGLFGNYQWWHIVALLTLAYITMLLFAGGSDG